MEKIIFFIKKNPELTTIFIGLIGCIIVGIAYSNLEIMFELVLGAIIFGVLIGLISYLIKIFLK